MIFNSIVTVLRIEKAVEQAEQLRKKKKTKPQDEDAAPEEEVPSNETIITSYLKDFKTYCSHLDALSSCFHAIELMKTPIFWE